MKLLICTQKVDANDPDLGFFVRWIEEFKKHCEVEVISLKDLGRGGKLARAWRLLTLARHKQYDAVFVHMNPEYVVAAGWYWRIKGKQIGLWYAHGAVNLKLRIATLFCNDIFTSTPGGFRLGTPKRHVLAQGIDTDFFKPGGERGHEVLSVGRLSKSKRHDVVIRALQYVHRELWIAGEGPERAHLEAVAQECGVASRVHLLGGRTQAELRELYRRAGVFVHTSTTGSLDKVVLEALACGCPVVTTSKKLNNVPMMVVEDTPQAIAAAIEHPPVADVEYVRREHSLQALIPNIITFYL